MTVDLNTIDQLAPWEHDDRSLAAGGEPLDSPEFVTIDAGDGAGPQPWRRITCPDRSTAFERADVDDASAWWRRSDFDDLPIGRAIDTDPAEPEIVPMKPKPRRSLAAGQTDLFD